MQVVNVLKGTRLCKLATLKQANEEYNYIIACDECQKEGQMRSKYTATVYLVLGIEMEGDWGEKISVGSIETQATEAARTYVDNLLNDYPASQLKGKIISSDIDRIVMRRK